MNMDEVRMRGRCRCFTVISMEVGGLCY